MSFDWTGSGSTHGRTTGWHGRRRVSCDTLEARATSPHWELSLRACVSPASCQRREHRAYGTGKKGARRGAGRCSPEQRDVWVGSRQSGLFRASCEPRGGYHTILSFNSCRRIDISQPRLPQQQGAPKTLRNHFAMARRSFSTYSELLTPSELGDRARQSCDHNLQQGVFLVEI